MQIKKFLSQISLNITLFWFLPLASSVEHRIDNFHYPDDYKEVATLIKNEWPRLFMQPEYDHSIVNKMLIHHLPGQIAYHDKLLHVKVLHAENKIAAFATYYYPSAAIGHIELLAVDKQFQSKGLGKKLIEYVCAEVARQGAKTLQLYVYTNNGKAIKFYTNLGFSVASNYPGYILLSKAIDKKDSRDAIIKDEGVNTPPLNSYNSDESYIASPSNDDIALPGFKT